MVYDFYTPWFCGTAGLQCDTAEPTPTFDSEFGSAGAEVEDVRTPDSVLTEPHRWHGVHGVADSEHKAGPWRRRSVVAMERLANNTPAAHRWYGVRRLVPTGATGFQRLGYAIYYALIAGASVDARSSGKL